MLAVRVIPVMLCKGRKLVKGKRWDNSRVVGVAAQAARVHASRSVDELLMLDIDATREHRAPDLPWIREISDGCFTPFTYGGGISTVAHIRDVLQNGADKVLLGWAAHHVPGLVREAAGVFGSQAIVVSIDHPVHTIADALRMEEMGAGEILLNNMERDGTMEGYDMPLVRHAARALTVPMIACGGCSGYHDMRAALEAGASAVAAGALFQFTDNTPKGAAAYLREHGIETRMP